MKTKETILKEVYSKIEARQVADKVVDDLLLEALDEYANQSKWISVEERLPDFDKEVLLFDDWKTLDGEERKDCRLGYLREYTVRKTSDGEIKVPEWIGTDFAFNITHWMLLPPPPIQSTQKPE